jgi:hypothetical protein
MAIGADEKAQLLASTTISDTPISRFIPNRGAVDLANTFSLLSEGVSKSPTTPVSPGAAKRKIHRGPECDAQKGKLLSYGTIYTISLI